MILESLIIPRFGVHFDLFWGITMYLGLPVLAGVGANLAPLRGKRLDRWILHQLAYHLGARRFDRFRKADGPAVYVIGGDNRWQ